MSHRLLHIFSCVAFLLFAPVGADAQPGGAPPIAAPPADLPDCSEYVVPEERDDARKLVLRGVSCFEQGEYMLALKHYRRARELSDANLLNAAIGRTFQELGYPFIARRYYLDYLAGPIEAGEGRSKIERRLKAVEAELAEESAEVELTSSPPGAVAYVVVEDSHWEELGETPMTVRMLPGKRRFIVHEDGFIAQTHDVRLVAGTRRTVDAALVDSGALFGLSGRSLQRTGVLIAGISLPVLTAGVSLLLVGKNKRSAAEDLTGDARDDEIMSGASMQQWGAVGTVVGTALLGTGITLYVIGRKKVMRAAEAKAAEETAWVPTVHVGPTSAGVLFRF